VHSLLNLLLCAAFPAGLHDGVLLVADVPALATIPSVLVRRSRRPLAALSWQKCLESGANLLSPLL